MGTIGPMTTGDPIITEIAAGLGDPARPR